MNCELRVDFLPEKGFLIKVLLGQESFSFTINVRARVEYTITWKRDSLKGFNANSSALKHLPSFSSAAADGHTLTQLLEELCLAKWPNPFEAVMMASWISDEVEKLVLRATSTGYWARNSYGRHHFSRDRARKLHALAKEKRLFA